MKAIYLRVIYETNIFPGDYSNGTFYDGVRYATEEEVKQILDDLVNKTGKIEMYPHAKDTYWSDPVFDESNGLKEFDFRHTTLDERDDGVVRFVETRKNGYKYHYWFEIADKEEVNE